MIEDFIKNYIREYIEDNIYEDEDGLPNFGDLNFMVDQIDTHKEGLARLADLLDTSMYTREEIKEHLIEKGIWKNEIAK